MLAWARRATGGYGRRDGMTGLDADEFRRWYGQAEHTLASAERDARASDFAWACFKAQQAAECAVKALLRAVGDLAVGHSLTKLLETLEARAGVGVPEELRQLGRVLDRHYIPTRYPDAFPAGMPHEFYDESTAAEALDAARRLAAFIRDQATAMGVRLGDARTGPSQEGSP